MAARHFSVLIFVAMLGCIAIAGCGGGSTQDRDVHGTELALGPIHSTGTQIMPDQLVELSAYAQVGTARGSSLSFPARPLLWECSAGTLGLDRDELRDESPGDWTDHHEVSAAVGQTVYWRAPQQKGIYELSVKMADLSQHHLLNVITTAERMVIETPTEYFALGQIEVPPTSLKPNVVVELDADMEVRLFGAPSTGGPEMEHIWSCSAGKLAETSAALTGLGPSADLMQPSSLTTRKAGKIFYRTPPQAGVYFITLELHRMEQEALVFIVAGP